MTSGFIWAGLISAWAYTFVKKGSLSPLVSPLISMLVLANNLEERREGPSTCLFADTEQIQGLSPTHKSKQYNRECDSNH